MEPFARLFDLKTYIMTAVVVISFSYSVGHLFGQTIPGVVLSFFKDAGEYVVLGAVFVFALAWLLRAKPPRRGRPRSYTVVVFDVYSKESRIDGIRTEFKTHDVAWSFMRQYKKSYPLCNFALVGGGSGDDDDDRRAGAGRDGGPAGAKRTIFRYI